VTRTPERIATGAMVLCAAGAGADAAYGVVASLEGNRGHAIALFVTAVGAVAIAGFEGWMAGRFRARRIAERDALRR
jgi:hypothetical protein